MVFLLLTKHCPGASWRKSPHETPWVHGQTREGTRLTHPQEQECNNLREEGGMGGNLDVTGTWGHLTGLKKQLLVSSATVVSTESSPKLSDFQSSEAGSRAFSRKQSPCF